jgi:Flp pilus assembly protein TadD
MSPRTPPRSDFRRFGLACFGLVAATLLVYGRVLGHGFVAYDTPLYVTGNPWVLRGLTSDGLRWAFTHAHASNWHPLTWLSHMLDVEVLGLRPGWHAFENVLWHAANACLVLLVFLRLTGAFGKSLLVAALFALHPLHVESVAWVVERKDVLSGFFGLLCVLAWARGARRAALLAFALGLLAKPMLVTWPFVLLLLDLGPLGRREVGLPRLLLEKVPFLALSALASAATVIAQSAGGAVQGLSNLPLAARLANVPLAYSGYLRRTFWPAGLSFHYPLLAHGAGAGAVIASTILLAAVTAFAVLARRSAPYLLLGWLFFLGTLVPVIGLVQVGSQSMADRYTYLPLLGVFAAVAWGGEALLGPRPILASSAVLVLGFLAWRQSGFWKDSRALAEHALAVNEEDYLAHDLLGIDLVAAGDLEGGAAHFRRALGLAPGDAEAASDLADVLLQQGRSGEAEAVLRRAVAIAPGSGALRRRLAIVLEQGGRFPEALAEAERAVAADASDAAALHVRAIALEALGRTEEARADLERSLDLAPEESMVRTRLARILLRKGDLDAAERELVRAAADDPSNVEARRGLERVRDLRAGKASR